MSAGAKRESGRLQDAERERILDGAARRRRQRRQLEALEQDNFQDDPHFGLPASWHKKGPPAFHDPQKDTPSPPTKKKKKLRGDHFKLRFRKTFQALLEEERSLSSESGGPAGGGGYFQAQAPPSRFPPRHFCAVCGNPSTYTCVQCGARYCRIKCLAVHKDTRCLKWTA